MLNILKVLVFLKSIFSPRSISIGVVPNENGPGDHRSKVRLTDKSPVEHLKNFLHHIKDWSYEMILLTYVVGVCLTDIFLGYEMSIVTVELRLFTRVFDLTRLHNYCKKYLKNYN